MLRNELEMVPRRFALALEFRDVRRQLIEIDFRGSRHRTDLKAESREEHSMRTEREKERSGRIYGKMSSLLTFLPSDQSQRRSRGNLEDDLKVKGEAEVNRDRRQTRDRTGSSWR